MEQNIVKKFLIRQIKECGIYEKIINDAQLFPLINTFLLKKIYDIISYKHFIYLNDILWKRISQILDLYVPKHNFVIKVTKETIRDIEKYFQKNSIVWCNGEIFKFKDSFFNHYGECDIIVDYKTFTCMYNNSGYATVTHYSETQRIRYDFKDFCSFFEDLKHTIYDDFYINNIVNNKKYYIINNDKINLGAYNIKII